MDATDSHMTELKWKSHAWALIDWTLSENAVITKHTSWRRKCSVNQRNCSVNQRKCSVNQRKCSVRWLCHTSRPSFLWQQACKGPSDGESAVVKSHASTTVKAGTGMISDGHEFFIYCTTSRLNKQPGVGCQHFVRMFFWVPAGTTNRDRPERMVKTVPGSVRCLEHAISTK